MPHDTSKSASTGFHTPSPPEIIILEGEPVEYAEHEGTAAQNIQATSATVVQPDEVECSHRLCNSQRTPVLADWYAILGVKASDSRHVIKKAFKAKVAVARAVRNEAGSAEELVAARAEVKLLEDAYVILRDPETRDRYDAQIAARRSDENESVGIPPKREIEPDIEESLTLPTEIISLPHPSVDANLLLRQTARHWPAVDSQERAIPGPGNAQGQTSLPRVLPPTSYASAALDPTGHAHNQKLAHKLVISPEERQEASIWIQSAIGTSLASLPGNPTIPRPSTVNDDRSLVPIRPAAAIVPLAQEQPPALTEPVARSTLSYADNFSNNRAMSMFPSTASRMMFQSRDRFAQASSLALNASSNVTLKYKRTSSVMEFDTNTGEISGQRSQDSVSRDIHGKVRIDSTQEEMEGQGCRGSRW